MICDDDETTAHELSAALRAAGYEAAACRHTMDVLRSAVGGQFDLVVIGLDMAGFGRSGAIGVLRELAPQVALIALHNRPSEIIRVAALAGVAAVLPRTVSARAFVNAVSRALIQQQSLQPAPRTQNLTHRPLSTPF
jgi:DNA-binding response OmpR family regulator